jgi:Lipocalin-like domain
MEQPAGPEQFVGTWRLVAMRANMGDDMPEQPYGPDPLGYITYTADGNMHAILMQRDRRPVGTPMEEFSRRTGLRRLAFLIRELPALARQASAAMKSMAYSATWELRGPELIHHVTASVLPDWIGAELRRTYEVDADRLVLTARYPKDRYVEITWQKVGRRNR